MSDEPATRASAALAAVARVLGLTRAMLDAGRGEDWPAVTRLQVQRDEHLAALFEGSLVAPVPALIAAQVRTVLEMNRELQGLAVAARARARERLAAGARGRRATSAYARTAAAG